MQAKMTFKQGFNIGKESFILPFKNGLKVLGFYLLAIIPSILFSIIMSFIFSAMGIDAKGQIQSIKEAKDLLGIAPVILITIICQILLGIYLLSASFIFAKKLVENKMEKIVTSSFKMGFNFIFSLRIYALYALIIGIIVLLASLAPFIGDTAAGIIALPTLLIIVPITLFAAYFIINEDSRLIPAIKLGTITLKNDLIGILGGIIFSILLTIICVGIVIAFVVALIGIWKLLGIGSVTTFIFLRWLIIILAGMFGGIITLNLALTSFISNFVFVTKMCKLTPKN